MAFDEKLADRIRLHLGPRPGLTERKMFGGIAFMLHGNMCCGVSGADLMARVDPAETDLALRRPHTRIFDMTGRPMKGWLLVAPAGLKTKAQLAKWVDAGVKYAESLPRK